MLSPITIRYPFRPARRSLAVARVADPFGLANEEPPHTIAEGVTLEGVRRRVLVLDPSTLLGKPGQLGQSGHAPGNAVERVPVFCPGSGATERKPGHETGTLTS